MNNTLDRFQRLRRAVKAYDRALAAYGLMSELGDQWVADSNELDRLWAAVLEAADIDSPARHVPEIEREDPS